MKISRLFERGRPVFSFEFFPPRTDAGYTSLFRTIAELKELMPGFVSVTWGAGGSTRRKTVELVARIQGEIGLTAMAHLTCIGSSREELAETLDRLDEAGIENVLALGGDRPAGYTPPQDRLCYASELARFIRSRWGFCLGGACYPETHPRAASREDDLRYLGEKVVAGVDFLITQLFFDNRDYFHFVDEGAPARHRGADRSGHHARRQRCERAAHGRALRRARPSRALGRARRRGRRSRSHARGRRALGHPPVPRAARARRAGRPLLHPQPLVGDPRHLLRTLTP